MFFFQCFVIYIDTSNHLASVGNFEKKQPKTFDYEEKYFSIQTLILREVRRDIFLLTDGNFEKSTENFQLPTYEEQYFLYSVTFTVAVSTDSVATIYYEVNSSCCACMVHNFS